MGWVAHYAGRQKRDSHYQGRAASARDGWSCTPRLFDRSDPLRLVALITVIAALGFTIGERGNLATWRIGIAGLALLGILVIQLVQPTTELLVARQRLGLPYLLGTSLLLVFANWLAPTFGLLILFFMLAAQAFAWLSPVVAVALIAPQLPVIEAARWLAGRPIATIVRELPQLALGVVFSAAFSLVITRYFAQRRRAEAFAEQLAITNGLLHTANERDKAAAAIEERLRIARDIHDGLGHHLTILAVQLQVAQKLLTHDPAEAASALAQSRREANAALGAVRESVAILRQEAQETRPLDERLRRLVEHIGHNTPLVAGFRSEGSSGALTEAAATLLYRAAQEGLTNAQKYAPNSTVTVILRHTPAEVALTVRNGGGRAAVEPPATTGGFGLLGLRERAAQLGGTLVAGPDATGFALTVTIPRGGPVEPPA